MRANCRDVPKLKDFDNFEDIRDDILEFFEDHRVFFYDLTEPLVTYEIPDRTQSEPDDNTRRGLMIEHSQQLYTTPTLAEIKEKKSKPTYKETSDKRADCDALGAFLKKQSPSG